MDGPNPKPWAPNQFKRHARTLDSSMRTSIIETDAGRGYIKAIGNPEGVHPLACELVCTKLAEWFGLPVLDHAILLLTDADTFPLDSTHMVEPGPAFITREITGHTWGGKERELRLLDNLDDIARLVVFDTWVLNPDRHPRQPLDNPPAHHAARARERRRDNVFLTSDGASQGHFRLIAIDFTHAISAGRELTPHLSRIDLIQDEGLYGLFHEFRPFITRPLVRAAAQRLREVEPAMVAAIIGTIPPEWNVGKTAGLALCDLLSRRAAWLADRIETRLGAICFPQAELEFQEERAEGDPGA